MITYPNMTDVLQAQKRLRPYLNPTPLEEAPELGVYFKLENLNKTRSFKIRGALNAMLTLTPEERERGVVACSAGNHAQGIAFAAQIAHTSAKIVMPAYVPKRKAKGVRQFGADTILFGDSYDAAEIHARKMETQIGMTFLSPYNHPQVIAGQGTIALELFDELPNLGRIIVPVSGGGLLSGIGIVCKTLNPACEVVGVQSIATPSLHNYFYGSNLPQEPTLADGLAGEVENGSITLDLCRRYTDQIVLVHEEQIQDAIRWMLQHHNWVIEGAAAVTIAALQAGYIELDDRPTAVVITGGNIDYDVLTAILNHKPESEIATA